MMINGRCLNTGPASCDSMGHTQTHNPMISGHPSYQGGSVDPSGRHTLTTLRLVLATAFATAAVLINDHGGDLGDVGVAVLVFAAIWLVVEEAIARVQLAVHRAFKQKNDDQHHDDGDRLAT